tara:strand:- start:741 stop:917 length:177 start_codon:yes stop_codon:yes gene_type:complete
MNDHPQFEMTLRRLENAYHDAKELRKMDLISSDEMERINIKLAECERIVIDAREEVVA